MNADQIKTMIAAGSPASTLNWTVMAATGMPPSSRLHLRANAPLQRHQQVYATLGDKMKTDEVHALSMKTYTPAEWAALALSAAVTDAANLLPTDLNRLWTNY